MPVTIPPGQPKHSSSSIPQPPLPADKAVEGIEIYRSGDPFDPRPADPVKSNSALKRALARITSAYRDAQSHIDKISASIREMLGLQKASALTHRADSDVVSAPFNVRKEKLPDALEEANQKALANALAENAAAQARADFVHSADNALAPEPMFVDADAGDYASYLKLCELKGEPPGDMICPQNFLPGVQRHAKAFIDLISRRQKAAVAAGTEFTLSSADQQKREVLAKLLTRSDDPAEARIGSQALNSAPEQTVTTAQLASFVQWRDWKNNGCDKGQPAPAIDFDGAQVYAKELLVQYKDADRRTNAELNDMLLDAESLLDHPEMYKVLLDGARPEGSVPARGQPAPKMPAPSSESASTPVPDRPAPRLRTADSQQRLSISEQLGLPPVSDMTMDDIARATDLFNQFTQEFERSPSGIKLAKDSPYLYPECVAVANDFVEMVAIAPDMTLSREQLAKLQAALALRELYTRYRQGRINT